MSRSLGKKVLRKKAIAAVSFEQMGRDAFARGEPSNGSIRKEFGISGGKRNAWLRGWNRARMEAQKK